MGFLKLKGCIRASIIRFYKGIINIPYIIIRTPIKMFKVYSLFQRFWSLWEPEEGFNGEPHEPAPKPREETLNPQRDLLEF